MTRARWLLLALAVLPLTGCTATSGGAGRPGLVGCYTDAAPTVGRDDALRPLIYLFCVQSP